MSEKSIPKFAIVEDSGQRFVLETRGPRYAGAILFSAFGLPFLLVLAFAKNLSARPLCGGVGVFLVGLAVYIVLDKE